MDVALAHPRSERGVEVREGAIEDVARGAHPLDFPGALAQTRRPELRDASNRRCCRQKVDDTGRRRVHRAKRVDPDSLRVTLPQHAGEHLAGVWSVAHRGDR